MQKNYKCSLCHERDYRFNLLAPCLCQADNKKNEDSGFVHKQCLEDLIGQYKHDLEAGEAPRCPSCHAPYDIDLTSSFRVQLSTLCSWQSLRKMIEMIFYIFFLTLFLLIISSLYFDLSHHPVVVVGFILCCIRAVGNMYDTILLRIYKSWVFINSIVSVKGSKTSAK